MLLAGVALPQTAPAPADGADPKPAQEEGTRPRPLNPATARLDWEGLVTRDGRVDFSERNSARAVETVRAEDVSAIERAAGLLAVGAGGVLRERPLLQSWAAEGSSIERRAAILGLGELGGRGEDLGEASELLLGLVDDPDREIADCAMLALLRAQGARRRARVEAIANDGADERAEVAQLLIRFELAPESSLATPAAELLLRLRWAAAREYGTVDGESWESAIAGELANDERFLDQLVLLSAVDLRLSGVRDHMLMLLLDGVGLARIEAAVLVMAPELDQLYQAGLWEPADEREWEVLVRTALESQLTGFIPLLLEGATHSPSTAALAAGVLARGDESYLPMLRSALVSPEPKQRSRGAHGAGHSRREALIPDLRLLEEDRNTRVRAEALVARFRLGDTAARRALVDFLAREPATPAEGFERSLVLEVLKDSWRYGGVSELLQELLPHLAAPELGGVVAVLFRRGWITDEQLLREALELTDPGSRDVMRIVEALAAVPRRENLALISDLFPAEARTELNGVLARALAGAAHPEVMPLLEQAVWGPGWDRSILAAGVVMNVAGLRQLMQWIETPPEGARSEDIRRLGFAIGAWGGREGIDMLHQRLGAHAGADRPALQGALLGYLASRTH